VELNTIAASFGSLSTQVSQMHRYLLSRHPASPPALTLADGAPASVDGLAESPALPGFAAAIAAAHGHWLARPEAHDILSGPGAEVVMVVQPGERNAYDQLWLQQVLWDRHTVSVLRRTLRELHDHASIDEDGNLRCDSRRCTPSNTVVDVSGLAGLLRRTDCGSALCSPVRGLVRSKF
jgi:glutathione synthase